MDYYNYSPIKVSMLKHFQHHYFTSIVGTFLKRGGIVNVSLEEIM